MFDPAALARLVELQQRSYQEVQGAEQQLAEGQGVAHEDARDQVMAWLRQ
jgi:hypothetical protein